jgi:hypothetical protein
MGLFHFALLLAFVIEWWPVLAGALIVVAVEYIVRSMIDSAALQRELARRRQARIAARADQENASVLAGDDRGVYGNYPEVRL